MEILDVGPLEILLIFVLMFVVMGPREMQKAGKTLGRWLNKLVKSDFWMFMRDISNTILHLPNQMMREANLDELKHELEINPNLQGVDDIPVQSTRRLNRKTGDGSDNSILTPGRSVSFSATPPSQSSNAKKLSTKTRAKKTSPAKSKRVKSNPANPKPKGKKRADA